MSRVKKEEKPKQNLQQFALIIQNKIKELIGTLNVFQHWDERS